MYHIVRDIETTLRNESQIVGMVLASWLCL